MYRFFRKIAVKYLKNRGLNHYVKGDFAGARSFFLKIEKRYPREPGTAYNLGMAELGLGNYAAAEDYLKRSASEDKAAPVDRILADLYYIWGQREKALNGYLTANATITNRKEKELVTERIAICRSEKSYKNVHQSYVRLQQGTTAMKQNETAIAQKAFQDAVKYDPTNYIALNNLGSLMLNEQKNGRKALRWFETAARFWDSPILKNNIKQARTALREGVN